MEIHQLSTPRASHVSWHRISPSHQIQRLVEHSRTTSVGLEQPTILNFLTARNVFICGLSTVNYRSMIPPPVRTVAGSGPVLQPASTAPPSSVEAPGGSQYRYQVVVVLSALHNTVHPSLCHPGRKTPRNS